MHALFTRTTRCLVEALGRTSFRGKFALVASLVAVLALPLPVVLLQEYVQGTERSEQGLRGLAVQGAVMRLERLLQMYRGRSAMGAAAGIVFRSELEGLAVQIEHALRVVRRAVGEFGNDVSIDDELAGIVQRWRVLREPAASGDPETAFDRHTRLIGDLLALMFRVAEQSGLTADRDRINHSLRHLLFDLLPRLADRTGQARGWVATVVAREQLHRSDVQRLRSLQAELDVLRNQVAQVWGLLAGNSPELAAAGGPYLARMQGTAAALDGRLRQLVLYGVPPAGRLRDPVAQFDAGTRAVEGVYDFSEHVIRVFRSRLVEFAAAAEASALASLAAALLMAAAVATLLWGIYRSALPALAGLRAGAERVANGDLEVSIDTGTADELAEVARSFNGMARSLASARGELESRLHELRQLNSAIERVTLLTTCDASGRVLEANEALLERTGLARGQLVGASLAQLAAGADSPEHPGGLLPTLRRGQLWTGPAYRLRTVDARPCWVSSIFVPFLDGGGRLRYFVGIRFDVTSERIAEQAVERERDFARSLVEGLTAPTFVLDPAGRVSIWNRALARLTGVPAAEVLGSRDHGLALAGEHSGTLADEILSDSAVNPRLGGRREVRRCRLRDGREPMLEMSAAPVRDAAGCLLAVASTVYDLSEQQALRGGGERPGGDARRAGPLPGRSSASSIAEMRAPIGGVVGLLELLDDARMDIDQRDCLRVARDAAAALLRSVDDVLDVAAIEAGRTTLQRVAWRPAEVVREVLDVLVVQAATCGVTLESSVDPELPERVCGDPVRLLRVLVNLAGSAVESGAGGRVTVSVAAAGESRLRWRVAGTGIDGEPVGRLLRSFGEADAATTPRLGGTRSGLDASRRLVELMGGSIEAVSLAGGGTEFSVELPLEACVDDGEAGETPGGAAPRPDWLRGCRALLVDDDEMNRVVLGGLLRRLGVRTGATGGGRAALRAVEAQPFDVVLVACRTPLADGLAAVRELRAREARTGAPRRLVVALTADAISDDRVTCLQAGCDEVLTMPVRGADLSRLLGRHLAAAGSTARPAVPAPGDARLDAGTVERLEALFGDELADIVRAYLEDAPKQLAVALGERPPGDADEPARAAHSLNSSSGQLGARALARLAAELERRHAAGDPPAAGDPLLAELRAEQAAVNEALQAMLREGFRPRRDTPA